MCPVDAIRGASAAGNGVPADEPHSDNRDVFRNTEFGLWAQRTGLEPGEEFMITQYLSPTGRTVEAGSGGGRILLDLQARGFSDLHGFDYLPEFVAAAQARDKGRAIDYQVQNAMSLGYATESFDQAIYLQQVLCFLPTNEDRRRAIQEAFRILRPGGIVIVSLLSYRTRMQSRFYRFARAYFAMLRTLTRRPLAAQYWPWLRRNDKIYAGAFFDRGPYMYWFLDEEAAEMFQAAGFEIVGVGTDAQVEKGALVHSLAELARAQVHGRLYFACRKPTPPHVTK